MIDKQGLRQSDLSELSGIATGTISGYRNGEKEPTITNLRKITQALNVSADYLLGLDKAETIDVSGLGQEDIAILRALTESLRNKDR